MSNDGLWVLASTLYDAYRAVAEPDMHVYWGDLESHEQAGWYAVAESVHGATS